MLSTDVSSVVVFNQSVAEVVIEDDDNGTCVCVCVRTSLWHA